MIRFHNQISQQVLASRLYFLAGLGFVVGFERHADVATDAHILICRKDGGVSCY